MKSYRLVASSLTSFFSNSRSCSHPSMIALNPIWRIRVSKVVYPFSRSPFKYASRILRSDLPSISLRTMSYDIVVTLIFGLCYNTVVQVWCVIWRLSWKRGKFGLGRCFLMGMRSSASTRTLTAFTLRQETAHTWSSVKAWIGLVSAQTSLTDKSLASISMRSISRSISVTMLPRRTSILRLRSRAPIRNNAQTAAQDTFRSGVGSIARTARRLSVSSACLVATDGMLRLRGSST